MQHKAASKIKFKMSAERREVLLLQEMTSFLILYRNQIESLKQEIAGMYKYNWYFFDFVYMF